MGILFSTAEHVLNQILTRQQPSSLFNISFSPRMVTEPFGSHWQKDRRKVEMAAGEEFHQGSYERHSQRFQAA